MKLQALLLIALVACSFADEDDKKLSEETEEPVITIDEPKPDSSESKPILDTDPTKPESDKTPEPVLVTDEPNSDSSESKPISTIVPMKPEEELAVEKPKPDENKIVEEVTPKPSGIKWPWNYFAELWNAIRYPKKESQ